MGKYWEEQTIEERLETTIKALKKDSEILNTPINYKEPIFRKKLVEINSTIFLLEMIKGGESMKLPWKEATSGKTQ